MKILFIPISIVSGLLAGLVSKKVFDTVWGLVDDEDPPEPETRLTTWPKLLAALALQGAIFRMMKGLVNRGTRVGFYRATGSWPGEERPDPA